MERVLSEIWRVLRTSGLLQALEHGTFPTPRSLGGSSALTDATWSRPMPPHSQASDAGSTIERAESRRQKTQALPDHRLGVVDHLSGHAIGNFSPLLLVDRCTSGGISVDDRKENTS